jgi:hypothetical protein
MRLRRRVMLEFEEGIETGKILGANIFNAPFHLQF